MSHRCVYHNPPRNVTTLSRPIHMTQANFISLRYLSYTDLLDYFICYLWNIRVLYTWILLWLSKHTMSKMIYKSINSSWPSNSNSLPSYNIRISKVTTTDERRSHRRPVWLKTINWERRGGLICLIPVVTFLGFSFKKLWIFQIHVHVHACLISKCLLCCHQI